MNTRRIRRRLRQRAGAVTKSCRDDDGTGAAFLAELNSQIGNGGRLDRNDGKVRRLRQPIETRDRSNAIDLRVAGVDEMKLSLESSLAEIAQDMSPNRPLTWAGADEGDGAGAEHPVETIGAHRASRCAAMEISQPSFEAPNILDQHQQSEPISAPPGRF